VQHPLDRHLYPAVVKSDEDFFSIYKDTDTRSDPEYVGANPTVGTASIPIGIEVRQHCYTWSTTLLRNAIVLLFEIHNKSGKPLNSCYVGTTLGFTSTADGYNASSWPQFAFDSERKFGHATTIRRFLARSIPQVSMAVWVTLCLSLQRISREHPWESRSGKSQCMDHYCVIQSGMIGLRKRP